MSRTIRLVLVICLTTAFIAIPWRSARAGEHDLVPTPTPSQSFGEGKVWRSALALVPSESRLMRQSVAATNESKLLLGLVTGSAVVAGAAMVAYGASSSCKGKAGNSTTTCERIAMFGAVGLAGGAMTLVLWTLSR